MIKVQADTITLETIYQVAQESKMCVLDAITMMQAGAAKIGDEATLDRLCLIKENYIDLYKGNIYDLYSSNGY